MSEEPTVYSFVRKKVELLDRESPWSRAMLAKLRRGIGKSPGDVPEIWEITIGDSPDEWQRTDGAPSYAEIAVHTALALYALHRQGKSGTMSMSGKDETGKNIGNSFGGAAAKLIDGNNEPAIKRRFDAVATATDFKELAQHARGLIQLLKAKDIVLDYPRFAQDLYAYQFPGGAANVRLRWGQDFYRMRYSNDKGSKNDAEK
jgi:CRISPR system Cascade subunit CasB